MPKIIISPAQALLILLEQEYQDPTEKEKLVSFYMNGIKDSTEKDTLMTYISNCEVLSSQYEVSEGLRLLIMIPLAGILKPI